MLNKETQSALINISMDAELNCYSSEVMNMILSFIQSQEPKNRTSIMQFLYCHQGATLRLFFEIMRYLPSVSNEPIISYKIK